MGLGKKKAEPEKGAEPETPPDDSEIIRLLRAIRLEIRAGAEGGPGEGQRALRAESDKLAEGGIDHE